PYETTFPTPSANSTPLIESRPIGWLVKKAGCSSSARRWLASGPEPSLDCHSAAIRSLRFTPIKTQQARGVEHVGQPWHRFTHRNPSDSGSRPRARIRIRQRLSRHGQRGGDRDLYELAEAELGCRVVRYLEPHWRVDVLRSRRIRHRGSPASRTRHQRRFRRGLRHGLFAVVIGDYLEPRDVVPRPAGFELTHSDRLHRGRWPDEFPHGSRQRL